MKLKICRLLLPPPFFFFQQPPFECTQVFVYAQSLSVQQQMKAVETSPHSACGAVKFQSFIQTCPYPIHERTLISILG